MHDPDCTAFLQWALPRLDLRWAGFRKVRTQVCKRLKRRIRLLGLSGFTAYRDLLDVMVIDQLDSELAPRVRELGLQVVVTDTIMRDAATKAALARTVLEAVE